MRSKIMSAARETKDQLLAEQCNIYLAALTTELSKRLEEKKKSDDVLTGDSRKVFSDLLSKFKEIKPIEIPKMGFDLEHLQKQAEQTIEDIRAIFFKVYLDAYIKGRISTKGMFGQSTTERLPLLDNLEKLVKDLLKNTQIDVLTGQGKKDDKIDAKIFACVKDRQLQMDSVKDIFNLVNKAILVEDKELFVNCLKALYRMSAIDEWNLQIDRLTKEKPAYKGYEGLKLDYETLRKKELKFSKDHTMLKEFGGIDKLFEILKKDRDLMKTVENADVNKQIGAEKKR